MKNATEGRTGILALRSCRRTSDNIFLTGLLGFGMAALGSVLTILVYMLFGLRINPWDDPLKDMRQLITDGKISAPFGFSLIYMTFLGIWLLAFLWILLLKNERPIMTELKMNQTGNRPWAIGLGILLGLGANAFCILLSVAFKDVSLEYNEFHPGWALLLFLAVAIQSGAEEVVCRMLIYQKLRRRYRNPWIAIIGNSVIFMAMHLGNDGINFWSVLQLLLVGILLTLFVCYFDSLWLAIFFHTAWNYSQNIIFGLKNSGTAAIYSIYRQQGEARTGFFYHTGFGVEGSAGGCLMLAVIIAVVLLIARRRKLQPKDYWAEAELEADAALAAGTEGVELLQSEKQGGKQS